MCFQCVIRPSVYLKAMGDAFEHIGWYFGEDCGEGIFEFKLYGTRYITSPAADIDTMGSALPGDLDPDGEPYFLEDGAVPEGAVFREHFWPGRKD